MSENGSFWLFLFCFNKCIDWIKEDLRAGTGSANLDFNEKIKKLRASGEKIHHLGFGQCPFPVPLDAVAELQKHAWRSTYAPMNGIPQLRESIVQFHKRFDGVTIYNESDVICGPGSKELIYLTLNALETTVIILKPAWPTYLPQGGDTESIIQLYIYTAKIIGS